MAIQPKTDQHLKGSVNNASERGSVKAPDSKVSLLAAGEELFLGAGDDIYNTGPDDDRIFAGGGNDKIHGNGGNDHLVGEAGNDTLYGDAGEDTLYGSDGNDQLWGNDGNDRLYGEGDDDYMSGGKGDDYLEGGDGDDILEGREGDDSLVGGDGNDTYVYSKNMGQDQVDTYSATTDVDTLKMTDILASEVTVRRSGENLIVERNGSADSVTITNHFDSSDLYSLDQIQFSNGVVWDKATIAAKVNIPTSGNDEIWLGNGNDTLNAGDGDDRVYSGGGNDNIDGGAGSDYISGLDGNDTLKGGIGDDVILGEDANDQLWGNDGNDLLYGGDGDDYLSGGKGDDNLHGEGGNDTVEGREGDDYLWDSDGDDTYVYSKNMGQDTIMSYGSTPDSDTLKLTDITSSEISLQRNEWGDLLVQRTGSNDLVTVSNHFEASGMNAIDTIQFSNGVTWDKATIATKVMQATNRDDRIWLAEEKNNFNAGQGNDLVYGGNDTDRLGGGAGNDTVYGQGGNDILKGGTAEDLLHGGEGNDQLWGNEGNDVLNGDGGNDYLSGGKGNDSLYGGEGNDMLEGREGDDTLNGGEGSDVYVYRKDMGSDTILDEGAAGTDTLQLSNEFTKEDIAFFQDGDDLKIGFTNSLNDSITVLQNETLPIERYQLSDGSFLTNEDLAVVVQSMASYASSEGIALSSVNDVQQNADLMNIISNSWHG